MADTRRSRSSRGSGSGDAATHVFHEKQYGSMCGQHCLNNLLQGPYFTPDDLAKIARELDQQEAALLRAAGGSSDDADDAAARSNNVDDSGNFSIQVLKTALQRSHEIQLVQDRAALDRVLAALAADEIDLSAEDVGFVCNLREHWFAIRSVRGQVWNLNSLKRRPQRVSLFYLDAYLATLRQEGYSIFLADGKLPPLLADTAHMGHPEDWYFPRTGDDEDDSKDDVPKPTRLSEVPAEDVELREALRRSVRSNESGNSDAAVRGSVGSGSLAYDESAELAAAMEASLRDRGSRVVDLDDDDDDKEDDGNVRRRRQVVDVDDDDEDAMLHAAIQASMQGSK